LEGIVKGRAVPFAYAGSWQQDGWQHEVAAVIAWIGSRSGARAILEGCCNFDALVRAPAWCIKDMISSAE
jgi:hypothetical protein